MNILLIAVFSSIVAAASAAAITDAATATTLLPATTTAPEHLALDHKVAHQDREPAPFIFFFDEDYEGTTITATVTESSTTFTTTATALAFANGKTDNRPLGTKKGGPIIPVVPTPPIDTTTATLVTRDRGDVVMPGTTAKLITRHPEDEDRAVPTTLTTSTVADHALEGREAFTAPPPPGTSLPPIYSRLHFGFPIPLGPHGPVAHHGPPRAGHFRPDPKTIIRHDSE